MRGGPAGGAAPAVSRRCITRCKKVLTGAAGRGRVMKRSKFSASPRGAAWRRGAPPAGGARDGPDPGCARPHCTGRTLRPPSGCGGPRVRGPPGAGVLPERSQARGTEPLQASPLSCSPLTRPPAGLVQGSPQEQPGGRSRGNGEVEVEMETSWAAPDHPHGHGPSHICDSEMGNRGHPGC